MAGYWRLTAQTAIFPFVRLPQQIILNIGVLRLRGRKNGDSTAQDDTPEEMAGLRCPN